MEAEAQREEPKNASILSCFCNVFGERGPGKVQATGDTSTLTRHGGGKAEGKWILYNKTYHTRIQLLYKNMIIIQE